MTAWLISVVGVVLVGVLVELILTDSPMSKFVRSIYAFFILLVIVSPLPGLIRNGIEVGAGVEYDWALINTINNQSLAAAQGRVDRALEAGGFGDVIVTILNDRESTSFRIERVFVNAWHHRDDAEGMHNIRRIVTITLNVSNDIVTIV